MRGFAGGTFALIVLYVALQPGTAGKAEAASGTFQSAVRRWLSGEVAGVPDKGSKAPANPSPAIGSDPRTSPGPKAETPPPGTAPSTPPYMWGLQWPGQSGLVSA